MTDSDLDSYLKYFADHHIDIGPLDYETVRRLSRAQFHVSRVRFFPNRTFELDNSGMPAGIVLTSTPRDPWGDWIAWAWLRPDKFAPERRSSSPQIVGGNQLVPGAPVRVWRTPLQWLQARALGAVIVNKPLANQYLAPGLHLIAEDEAHKAELEKAALGPITVTVAGAA
jgi:hypothetical protein